MNEFERPMEVFINAENPKSHLVEVPKLMASFALNGLLAVDDRPIYTDSENAIKSSLEVPEQFKGKLDPIGYEQYYDITDGFGINADHATKIWNSIKDLGYIVCQDGEVYDKPNRLTRSSDDNLKARIGTDRARAKRQGKEYLDCYITPNEVIALGLKINTNGLAQLIESGRFDDLEKDPNSFAGPKSRQFLINLVLNQIRLCNPEFID